MKNRFLEWDIRNLPTTKSRNLSNGIATSKSTTSTKVYRNTFYNRSSAFSVQQTSLVILIENGGVDLGIPDLVDSIISKVPGSSFFPDTLREQLIKILREKIKGFTDGLIETAELSLNRYTSAAPNLFNSVIVLRNSSASYEDLKNTLIKLSRDNVITDLLILTHGSNDSIAVLGDINSQKIRDMKSENGAPLKIRSVYMMNCVGSTLNDAWIEAGAKTSCGTIKNNYIPEPTTFFFWNNWKAGQSFETAATTAYKQTIAAMNAVVKSLLALLPGGSAIADSINFADFEFVQDSAPQVAGTGSVTIKSKDLSFTQSLSYSPLTTTVVRKRSLFPSKYTRSMSDMATPTMTASANCINMIKKLEGFKERKYSDGSGNCAIGYGSVLHAGACNDRDNSELPYMNGITEAQATELLVARITAAQKAVRELVKVELNQNQFDALVSFVHNITPEAFANCLLLKMLNEGNLGAIPAELKKWVKGKVDNNAVIVPELVKRRETEASLFASSTPVVAQSLSFSNYSRPFYDTGEHSLMGQYIDSVKNAPIAGMDELSPTRFYSVNGVQFTYGQIITMGDFYDNYAQMSNANASELEGLKNLIIRSENLYKNSLYKMGVGNAADPSQSDWNTVTGGRYLDLAAVNNSHFAPPPPESVFKSSKQPNNKSTWEFYHREAINKVRGGSTDDDYYEALKINAFADHFLTDAFSAGHLVNKELMIEHFKILVMSGGKVDADGTSLLDAIAKQSFKGAVAAEFSKYQTVDTRYQVNGFLDDANMFRTLLIGILELKPDKIANLFVKAIHDALNAKGVPVTNAKGQSWHLSGDGTLNDKNLLHIQEAVKQSVLNVRDAVTDGSTGFDVFAKKVWDYVPIPTHPTTKAALDAVFKDYSNFKTGKLITKAVDLITREHMELISELRKENAIEPRESGVTHPINTIGNWVNDNL